MFRWISWVLRVVATALLLSFLCIWTTGYIVNSYMESALKQLNLPLEVQPLALSGVWGTLWGAERAPEKRAVEEAASGSASHEPTPSAGTEPQAAGGYEEPSAESKETEEATAPPEPANASPEPDDGSENTPEEAVPVFGELSAIAQLNDEQRQSLYALVVSKLNAEQLSQLSNYLQDGLTAEELASMQEMLQSVLTDEEYSRMVGLLQGGGMQEE